MKIDAREKVERNKKILELLANGWTYTQVMKEFNLKSKGNIWQIVKRHKDRMASLELSTG